jgi:hypothetical protein
MCYVLLNNLISTSHSSTRHASCALLLLHSIPNEAENLWSFFPAKLQAQTRQLQELLMNIKYVARSQTFARFFRWQEVSGLSIQLASVACVVGAVVGSGGVDLGIGAKMKLVMQTSLLRALVFRLVPFLCNYLPQTRNVLHRAILSHAASPSTTPPDLPSPPSTSTIRLIAVICLGIFRD